MRAVAAGLALGVAAALVVPGGALAAGGLLVGAVLAGWGGWRSRPWSIVVGGLASVVGLLAGDAASSPWRHVAAGALSAAGFVVLGHRSWRAGRPSGPAVPRLLATAAALALLLASLLAAPVLRELLLSPRGEALLPFLLSGLGILAIALLGWPRPSAGKLG